MLTRWAFNVTDWNPEDDVWQTLLKKETTEEAERISKFYFRYDAKLSLAGRLLIHKFIAQYVTQLEINDKSLICTMLKRTKSGKPYLKRTEENKEKFFIDFNVSTAGDYVVLCGIAGSTSTKINYPCLGVDIMKFEIRGKDKVCINLLSLQLTIIICLEFRKFFFFFRNSIY